MTDSSHYQRPPFWPLFNPPHPAEQPVAEEPVPAEAVPIGSIPASTVGVTPRDLAARAAALAASVTGRPAVTADASSEWEEEKHPRGEHGKFGPGNGGTKSETVSKVEDKPVEDKPTAEDGITVEEALKMPGVMGGSGTREDPFQVSDLNTAAALLIDGQHQLELDRPDGVGTLLSKLADYSRQCKAEGIKAPTMDLCNVSVPGTNLFCADAVKESRTEMPQLATKSPIPGSPADKMLKDQQAEAKAAGKPIPDEVDLGPGFRGYLEAKGYTVSETSVLSDHLHASQRELNGGKVAAMMLAKEAGTMPPGRIMSTGDNYIVDGHHRWASDVGLQYDTGKQMSTDVYKIGHADAGKAGIINILNEANTYAAMMGSPAQAAALSSR